MSSGLYFHIPFCRSKCPYCDFYSVRYDPLRAKAYVELLCEELKKYDGAFDTVYLGGGTPSVLEPEWIAQLLDAARRHFTISSDAEITVECNPSKNLERDFAVYAQAGVNRISLGMQSARKEERCALGRTAGRTEIAKAVGDARRCGITNISLDLMLGTPKQTLSSLDESLAFIGDLAPSHVSAYLLKIEEGTPFAKRRDSLALPDEDTVCEMYLKTAEALEQQGLLQYEISNFAKPGYESRHNLKYWQLDEYLGIGKSAHSLWHGKRFYYDTAMHPVPDGDGGSEEECIMLGLRLTRGVPKALIKKDYAPFLLAGLMTEDGDSVRLTRQGMLVSNHIIAALM